MTIINFGNTKSDFKREEKRSDCLNLTVLILILINSSFACILLIRNGYHVQSNNVLLEILVKQLKVDTRMSAQSLVRQPAQEFERIIDNRECPPCPTDPPTIVIPNKDPVSVLNEEVGKDAVYDCLFNCENPPIHTSKLTVDDYPGTWNGRGATKVAAKQQAAYNAMKQHFPQFLDGLTYEDKVYNPTCKDESSLVEVKEKC